ncbi:MAG: DUF3800 domain-containing protein [Rubrivivax sp.]|nr:DUF3800 domain-containing protein [Pyrinomonadaceae bacterium]
MAYFLFIDESGQDHRKSPYEVLAGVAVEDRDLWNLIKAVQATEERIFGTRYSLGADELKAKRLLKTKVFRQAAQMPPIPEQERSELARSCLENGATAGRREITALAQAKLDYVAKVFEICSRFRCRAFASIMTCDAPVPASADHLRKDYAYLFERFYYFLEDKDSSPSGIIVFDELEKSRSHILLSQMDSYFKRTVNGRLRSGLIVPEPFFVHSDLTTGVQLADLVAYTISWGLRFPSMTQPARAELSDLAALVRRLQYTTRREVNNNPDYLVHSYVLITDLRPRDLQNGV